MTYIPSRFKLPNVERFAQIIKDVSEGEPVIRFSHDKMSLNANTAISRVRDAVLAVIRGITPLPNVDVDKLKTQWPLYHVDYDQMTREVIVRRSRELPIVEPLTDVVELTLRVEETHFVEDLTALAVLFGNYRLRGRVTIIGMLDDKVKQLLISEHNALFSQIKPNETLMS